MGCAGGNARYPARWAHTFKVTVLTLDTHAVFLDLSKAFDRVWHESLLYKIRANGISGKLLSLIKVSYKTVCRELS